MQKLGLILIVVFTALLFFGCTETNNPINPGNNPIQPKEDGYNIQIIDLNKSSPVSNLRIDLSPVVGTAQGRYDYSKTKTYTTDANGLIFISYEDMNYLLFSNTKDKTWGRAKGVLSLNGKKVGNEFELSLYQGTGGKVVFFITAYKVNLEGGKTINKIEYSNILYIVEPIKNPVYEIKGEGCPFPDESNKTFELPTGCIYDENINSSNWSYKPTITCDSNILLDLNCFYYDSNNRLVSGGILVKQNMTNKTLIQCSGDSYSLRGQGYLKHYDFHPGPQIGVFFLGYDFQTKEITSLTNQTDFFKFIAPIESESEVWEALKSVFSANILCNFKSKGFAPYPKEGEIYPEDYYGWEEFTVPKEEIFVSTIAELIDTSVIAQQTKRFNIKLLTQNQGCPCYFTYINSEFELTGNGDLSTGYKQIVYSGDSGCVC